MFTILVKIAYGDAAQLVEDLIFRLSDPAWADGIAHQISTYPPQSESSTLPVSRDATAEPGLLQVEEGGQEGPWMIRHHREESKNLDRPRGIRIRGSTPSSRQRDWQLPATCARRSELHRISLPASGTSAALTAAGGNWWKSRCRVQRRCSAGAQGNLSLQVVGGWKSPAPIGRDEKWRAPVDDVTPGRMVPFP